MLNNPAAKYQDLQIQELPSGADWAINPACVASCELEKVESTSHANLVKKKLKVIDNSCYLILSLTKTPREMYQN